MRELNGHSTWSKTSLPSYWTFCMKPDGHFGLGMCVLNFGYQVNRPFFCRALDSLMLRLLLEQIEFTLLHMNERCFSPLPEQDSYVKPQLASAGQTSSAPGVQTVLQTRPLRGLCWGNTVQPSPCCRTELSGIKTVVNGALGEGVVLQ